MSQFHFVVGWLFPLQIFLSNIEHRLVVVLVKYILGGRAPLISNIGCCCFQILVVVVVVVVMSKKTQMNRDDYYDDDSAFGQLMMICIVQIEIPKNENAEISQTQNPSVDSPRICTR